MNYYVYEITNNINGKKYIGKRKCSCKIEDDCYMGSGAALSLAKKKYGSHNFSKRIIEVCNSEEEAYKREEHWINHFDAVNSDEYYNLIEGGRNNKYKNMTKKQRAKMESKKKTMGLYKEFYEKRDAAWEIINKVRYEDAKVILGERDADIISSDYFKQWEVAEMYDEIYLYREPEEEYSVEDEYMEMMYDGYSKNEILYGFTDFYE